MEIVMPKMGESISEGTIIKWHKKPGDTVKKDEIIFEISTDKVDTEIPSPADGILEEIKVKEGETVEVGTVVAVVSDSSKPTAKPVQNEEKPLEETPAPVSVAQAETESIPNSSSNEQINNTDLVEVEMPKMGESVMEGTIIKWYKKQGDKVNKDETIFEISTDKVDTEVPSPAAGVISEILVAEQETVSVGTVVAKISVSGKVPSEIKTKLPEQKTQPVVQKEEIKTPVPVADKKESSIKQEKDSGVGFLSPLVLSIAKKENISFDELSNIKGTGISGRITKNDVLNYLENRKTTSKISEIAPQSKTEQAEAAKPAFVPVSSTAEVDRIPMDNIRQKIMQHMINSRDTSVHVTEFIEVDMTKIYNFLKAKRDEYLQKEGVKLTYMAFIADACVKALKEFPLMNSSVDENTIIQKKYINLGIAVAVEPAGLIVPNIKKADERNIVGLAKAINDIAYRARNKKLTPDDISNGTFSITNYGVFGTMMGTPIINQPEVGILGVGTVIKRPVVVELDGSDTIAIKPILILSLAHDHRLIDGMIGGKFIKFVKDKLESFDPSSM